MTITRIKRFEATLDHAEVARAVRKLIGAPDDADVQFIIDQNGDHLLGAEVHWPPEEVAEITGATS